MKTLRTLTQTAVTASLLLLSACSLEPEFCAYGDSFMDESRMMAIWVSPEYRQCMTAHRDLGEDKARETCVQTLMMACASARKEIEILAQLSGGAQ